MRIPSDRNWTQLNKGDIAGILHDSENISLAIDGKVRLARKAFNRYNSDNDANITEIYGIAYFEGQYIVLTEGNIFLYDYGSNNVTEIAASADVQFNSDLLVCYSRAYITTNDNLDYVASGSLTQTLYALTAAKPHPMALFDSLPDHKLAIGNGNTVVCLNSSHAASSDVLTIPAQYTVTSLAYRNGYLYVGTKENNGGEAQIFVWNGSGSAAQYDIPVGASQVYSIVPYKSTVAFLTNMGRLCEVSGNSYTELASFPVASDKYAIWDNYGEPTVNGKVLNRGMVTINDCIYMLIDGTVDSGNIQEMKHGLWIYDPLRGLYHHTNSSSDRSVVETPSALSSDTLTLSTHYLKDGDLVIVRAVGSLTGVTTSTKYFAKVVSSTQIKLALTRNALKKSKYVTIGGAVTSSSVSYTPNTDYSQAWNSFSGAICAINPEEPFFSGWETPVIWGNRLQKPDGTAFYGLMGVTDAWNIGRITTQRIYSDNITQSWNKLYGFFAATMLDNEKIIIKCKYKEKYGRSKKIIKGVWLSTTTINSIGNEDEDEWRDIEVGDELLIVDGYGRGYSAHVREVSLDNSTKSLVLDEEIGTANEDVYFTYDNFKKVTEITNANTTSNIFSAIPSGESCPWIQIRIEMRGFEIELDMLELLNKVHSSGN